jgi:NTE family protein
MKLKSNDEIGLALGGGAVLGAVHVGVLKAFEENNIKIKCIAGTSIGSLVAALFAFGMKADDIETVISDQSWLDISSVSLNRMGLLSNNKLGQLVSKNINDKNIEDAQVPLAIVACDIVSGEKVVIKKGNVAEAVMASTCIPGIFKPITIGDHILVDGGIVENLPISPIKEFGCDTIVGVDLTNIKNIKPKNMFDVLMNTLNITLKNATLIQRDHTDIVISPDLTSFNMIDTKQISELIEVGYDHANKIIETD